MNIILLGSTTKKRYSTVISAGAVCDSIFALVRALVGHLHMGVYGSGFKVAEEGSGFRVRTQLGLRLQVLGLTGALRFRASD